MREAETSLWTPAPRESLLRKVARKSLEAAFNDLPQDEQRRAVRRLWASSAGGNWIESKRESHRAGGRAFFVEHVRAPFEAMLLDVFARHRALERLVEIGAGPGDFAFEFVPRLPGPVVYLGLDLNAEAVARDREAARARGLEARVRFEQAEAVEWACMQETLRGSVVVTIAALKFFPEASVRELFRTLAAKGPGVCVALCEDALADYARHGCSAYFANLSYSHNYPALLRQAGFEVERLEERRPPGGDPATVFVLLAARSSP